MIEWKWEEKKFKIINVKEKGLRWQMWDKKNEKKLRSKVKEGNGTKTKR